VGRSARRRDIRPISGMPNSLRRTAIRGRASQRSCAPVERIDLGYQPIAQRRPGRGKRADARPRRLDAPILLRKILDRPSRRSTRPSASRLHPALEYGIARRAERWPQFEKPPPSTPGDLVFSACGRRGSHFSVAASLVGGTGRLADQPAAEAMLAAIGAALQVIVVLYRS
jgi:hypothetical protein